MNNKINDLLKELGNLLDNLNAIDVLGKSCFVSTFIYTDFFKIDKYNAKKYKDAAQFISSYYMTHNNFSENTMNFKQYDKICSLIEEIHFNTIIDEYYDDTNIENIIIGQNITTEILPAFRTFQYETLLKYQEDIIKKRFSINYENIIMELDSFFEKYYSTIQSKKYNNIKDVINKFEKFYYMDNFVYTGNKTHDLIESISCNFGELDIELFSYQNLLSAIDVGRKCAFRHNDKIYIFDLEIFISRLCKCLERSCCEYNIEWSENTKRWTEEMPCSLLEKYLSDGTLYVNNYYFPSVKSKRSENDILFIYKNSLFVIEIKGGKVNPDPIIKNVDSVKKSYIDQIEKGIDQLLVFIKYLNEKKSFKIYNENNEEKTTIDNNFDDIIPIVITYEEMPALLPDYLVHNHHKDIKPVVLNFYDFLTIFDYLDNPFLILDYFSERTKIKNSNSRIDDELFYLGIYTTETTHLSCYIDEQGILDRNNITDQITNFYFDTADYYRDIELYYTNFGSEKKIFTSIEPLILKMLNTDYTKVNIQTFNAIQSFVKRVSPDNQKLFIDKYKNCKKRSIILTLKEINIGFYIKEKDFLNIKEYYAFLLQYFIRNEDIKYVVVAIENEIGFTYEQIYRNSIIFMDKEVIEISKRNLLNWKRSNI